MGPDCPYGPSRWDRPRHSIVAPCILCGCVDASTVFSYGEPDRYEKALGATEEGHWRRWVRCVGCGLHRSEGSAQDRLSEIYRKLYREAGGLRTQTPEELFLRILSIPPEESETTQRIAWLEAAIQSLGEAGIAAPERSLLDVGGASGVFAHSMSERGWEASVIDPSQSGHFLTRHGVGYTEGRYTDIPPERTYGLVSMLYLLEHLQDPVSALRKAGRELAQGGLIFLELPDDCTFGLYGQEHPAFASCHRWSFSPGHAAAIADLADLRVHALQRYRTRRGQSAIMVLAGRPI
jgi:hypothetical protein